jgi:hypothetical protein
MTDVNHGLARVDRTVAHDVFEVLNLKTGGTGGCVKGHGSIAAHEYIKLELDPSQALRHLDVFGTCFGSRLIHICCCRPSWCLARDQC